MDSKTLARIGAVIFVAFAITAAVIDATRKRPMPPLALPRKEFMEDALAIWNELGLPPVTVPSPWHGYTLGEWGDDWEAFARNAVNGDWEANGLQTLARQRPGLDAETPVRKVEKAAPATTR